MSHFLFVPEQVLLSLRTHAPPETRVSSSIQHLVTSTPPSDLWASQPWVEVDLRHSPASLMFINEEHLPAGGPDPPLKRCRGGWSLIRCEIGCQSLHWGDGGGVGEVGLQHEPTSSEQSGG